MTKSELLDLAISDIKCDRLESAIKYINEVKKVIEMEEVGCEKRKVD